MSPARRLVLAWCAVLLTGCAVPPPPLRDASFPSDRWTGRLALQIDSDPPQHFSAGFELSGQAAQGELRLVSPLGQVVASARWTSEAAWLQRGNDQQRYADMNDLTAAVTGTALPLEPLFRWLRGEAAEVEGWQADLSRHAEGRLLARRLQPLPAVQLRMVFH
ncbi:lipoprotein insertase outer membrane protein LolB [Tepidicella baoligensis]|uniref:lipoprotein insertase outer membrane protein LolB n=1 Tax=Tepidicella baoligensis TaxID=2707016 RepID=UPI0015DA0085|nr:lipoprotein insertase outer membrane protein LolB [Tepidicella baoligensis]